MDTPNNSAISAWVRASRSRTSRYSAEVFSPRRGLLRNCPTGSVATAVGAFVSSEAGSFEFIIIASPEMYRDGRILPLHRQNLAEGAARGSWSKLQAMGHFLGRQQDSGSWIHLTCFANLSAASTRSLALSPPRRRPQATARPPPSSARWRWPILAGR